MSDKKSRLQTAVKDYIKSGCHDFSNRLGIVEMIKGYALMLNADETHFFWLRWDGTVGYKCWDKWWVYRSAKLNKQMVRESE